MQVILISNGQIAEECDATGDTMKIYCRVQKNPCLPTDRIPQFYSLLTMRILLLIK